MFNVLKQNPDCQIFRVLNSDNKNILNCLIEPTQLKLIPDLVDDYFIVKSILIKSDKSEQICYMDMITPERVSEHIIIGLDKPIVNRYYRLKNIDVLPLVASDCFGLYELYYSKINPLVGINILKAGLSISKEKSSIAEDLGYIYQDEKKYNEALAAFLISEENGPSSSYVYWEIESIYRQKGMLDLAKVYKEKFEVN